MVTIHIIGGGLAGSEAAWQIARAGLPVTLHEMRPARRTAAHQTEQLAELVCSNSLKSDQGPSASWLLKEELRRLDSLLIGIADRMRVPGGHALTVDREAFAGELIRSLDRCYGELEQRGFPAIAFRWESFFELKGRKVRVEMGDRLLSGTARGIDRDGALLVERSDGRVERAETTVVVRYATPWPVFSRRGDAGVLAEYSTSPCSPAAARRASTRSVFSQVNSGSSRPKWPYAAVLR